MTPNWAQLAAYRKVKSYVDGSTAGLIATIPDLGALEPAADNQQAKKALGTILDRVGKNVRQFYAQFPETTSREQITMEILGPDGDVYLRRDQTFRYLAVAPAGHGVSALLEYRTHRDGKPVEPGGLTQGFVLTQGYASAAIYFHPTFRSDSSFRYLGRQKLDGKDTDVIAFAQRPAWADLPIQVSIQGRTASLLVQGLAWVDPANYQIVRMRTDLLVPSPTVGLMGQTTVINFSEVHFHEMPGTVLWLPRTVTVRIKWQGNVYSKTTFDLPGRKGPTLVSNPHWVHVVYRNIHRYSDYRLFSTKSKIKY